MQHFLIISFVIGVTIFNCGCSEDRNTITLNKKLFTGKSIFKADLDPGVVTELDDGRTLITNQKAAWYDSTNSALITGKSIWTANWLKEEDGNAQIWATAEILVEVGRGKWELTWCGTRTPTDSCSFFEMKSPFRIKGDAIGKGVEGEVLGMEAKWTYTMDFNGDLSTLFYKIEGYMIK